MPASSLSRMARKACEKNLHMITDLGDAPFEIVKPLLKLMDPLQLHELEQVSPQLIGRDVEVWKMFIKRDVMQSDKLDIAPDDPSEWYSIYRALLDAQEERLANADATLRNLRYNAEAEKNKNAARRVELSAVKPPPGSIASKEVIRMTKTERRHLRDSVRGRFVQSEYRSKGDIKQPNEAAAKPKSKLTKIRNAAVQMNRVFNSGANRAQVPVAQNQITRAPASFMEQHRTQLPQPSKPAVHSDSQIKPRKRRVDEIEADLSDDFVAQRKRLKAIAKQSPPPASKQAIKSVSDISKNVKTIPTGRETENQSKAKDPEVAQRLETPPTPAVRKSPLHSVQASRSIPGPSPPMRPRKAPVDIFMTTKRKRVS